MCPLLQSLIDTIVTGLTTAKSWWPTAPGNTKNVVGWDIFVPHIRTLLVMKLFDDSQAAILNNIMSGY